MKYPLWLVMLISTQSLLTSCVSSDNSKGLQPVSAVSQNNYAVPKKFTVKKGSIIDVKGTPYSVLEDIEAVSLQEHRVLLTSILINN